MQPIKQEVFWILLEIFGSIAALGMGLWFSWDLWVAGKAIYSIALLAVSGLVGMWLWPALLEAVQWKWGD